MKLRYFLFPLVVCYLLFFVCCTTFAIGWKIEVGLPGLPAGTEISSPAQYLEKIFSFLFGLGAILAVVMIIYGGFLWMTSPAVASKDKGREMIIGAISGLLLLLASYLILNTINPELTGLSNPALTNISPATGGGDNNGGTNGGTFTGQASNANGQKLMETFYKNPSKYAQDYNWDCAVQCKELEEDAFPNGSTFVQFGYGYKYAYNPGQLNYALRDKWASDLEAGLLPNVRINGGASGQHWIIIYAIEGDNISFFNPAGGQDQTLSFTTSGTNGGYYFGAPTASDPYNDGWGGYIKVW